MPPCAPSCFLWSILRRTKRLLERQFEVREDLEDLLQNEPALREATMQIIFLIHTSKTLFGLVQTLGNFAQDRGGRTLLNIT